MIEGALVLPEQIYGIIDASATLKFLIPWTFNYESTTLDESFPILQLPTGWYNVSTLLSTNDSISL